MNYKYWNMHMFDSICKHSATYYKYRWSVNRDIMNSLRRMYSDVVPMRFFKFSLIFVAIEMYLAKWSQFNAAECFFFLPSHPFFLRKYWPFTFSSWIIIHLFLILICYDNRLSAIDWDNVFELFFCFIVSRYVDL